MKTIKLTRSFPNELMDKLRQMGDPLADAVISELHQTEGLVGVRSMFSWLNSSESVSSYKIVNEFFQQNNALPVFADKKLMQKGMMFFIKNQNQIGLILACYSLPYCYAGADGARVLAMSQRIQTDTLKRLEETGEFIQIITQEKNWKNGEAIRKILKVRLMHGISWHLEFGLGKTRKPRRYGRNKWSIFLYCD
jgi:hypothetical protein